MDGVLLLDGYKLKQRLYINLQKITIITTHGDYYTPVIIFDLLQNYFNKKDFSDKFLNEGVFVALNEKELATNDLIVFRIEPKVNLENEIKITKKTILGQILEQKFKYKQDIYENILYYFQKDLINELDNELNCFGLKANLSEENIFNFAKLIEVDSYIDENIIFPKEHEQWLAKIMLVNYINKLKLKKPKLLLCELPEHGLDEQQLVKFFKTIKQCDSIENAIIYTNSDSVLKIIDDIYAYHIIKENTILGFDDYDEMLKILLDKYNYGKNEAEITEILKSSMFCKSDYERLFVDIDKMFRQTIDK